jgi:hypothetical protein
LAGAGIYAVFPAARAAKTAAHLFVQHLIATLQQ